MSDNSKQDCCLMCIGSYPVAIQGDSGIAYWFCNSENKEWRTGNEDDFYELTHTIACDDGFVRVKEKTSE